MLKEKILKKLALTYPYRKILIKKFKKKSQYKKLLLNNSFLWKVQKLKNLQAIKFLQ
jgi:hypothetical protein